jgi:hypothetical protein
MGDAPSLPSGAGDSAVVSNPPHSGVRSIADLRARKVTAITVVVVLIVTFGLTLMIGLYPVLPLLAAGVFLFAVLLRGNYSLIVHAFLLVTFTARTQELPHGFRVLSFYIWWHEPLIIGSLCYAIWLLRAAPSVANRLRHSIPARVALLFSVVVVVGIILGILYGHPLYDIQYDVRPPINMMIVVFIAAVIVAVDDWQRYIKTITVSLIFSAVLMVYASATGMQLGGRNETAQLYAEGGRALAGGSNAMRYLTDATLPALAVLLGCAALLTLGRVRLTQVTPMLIASLVISVLSFSRTTILALAGAFVFAFLIALLNGHLVRLALRLVLMPLVTAVALFALLNLGNALGGQEWIKTQTTGYVDRVISGLAPSNVQADTSVRYRAQEDQFIEKTGAESPILGGGFGQRYKPPTGKRGTFTAVGGQLYSHNVYNWFYIKSGLAGVVAFLALIATSVLPALLRHRGNLLLTTAASTLVGLSLAMLYSPIPIDQVGSPLLGIVIGLCIGAGTLKVSRTADLQLNSQPSISATPDNP